MTSPMHPSTFSPTRLFAQGGTRYTLRADPHDLWGKDIHGGTPVARLPTLLIEQGKRVGVRNVGFRVI